MTVYIPSPLRSYTRVEKVESDGRTVDEALHNLDRRFPGIRFRIINEQDGVREHIKLFVNEELTNDLFRHVTKNDRIHIICALSGG